MDELSHTRDTGLPEGVQPQVVFEIRSRDQPLHDLITKCNAYIEAGVKEAVLIDPQGHRYWVYKADDLEPEEKPDTEWWESEFLPDFRLCVALITRPEDDEVDREYKEYLRSLVI